MPLMTRIGKTSHAEPTIRDIAEYLHLSHPTVSRALRDHPSISYETRRKVREAADKLGYVPNSSARMLRQTQSDLIGVIFPDIQNDFYSSATATLGKALVQRGQKLMLAISEDDPALELKLVQGMREARVAGVVIAPTAELRPETLRLLQPIPTLQLLRHHPGLSGVLVGVDESKGIALAVSHLASLGHQRIGFIVGNKSLSTGRGRTAGYRKGLLAAGLPIDETLILHGAPRPEFGYTAMEQLLALSHPPSAVVIASSQLTLGSLDALRQHSISIPKRLSVIAYHDPDWFALWGPGISAVRLPVKEMADTVAALLLHEYPGTSGRAEDVGANRLKKIIFEPQLIIRGTTARPVLRQRRPDRAL